MSPLYRALSAFLALLAGFAIPVLLALVFRGVSSVGVPAIAGLIALAGAVTLLLLVARGRLRF